MSADHFVLIKHAVSLPARSIVGSCLQTCKVVASAAATSAHNNDKTARQRQIQHSTTKHTSHSDALKQANAQSTQANAHSIHCIFHLVPEQNKPSASHNVEARISPNQTESTSQRQKGLQESHCTAQSANAPVHGGALTSASIETTLNERAPSLLTHRLCSLRPAVKRMRGRAK